ncbi:MAG: serine/threonine protein phosphatase [Hyphomonadaceae bacterium]|nr:serine/threonine protein phosphatase [Hyphomonadaceae bacterium]
MGFAIGDIHGRADLLARMFDRLDQQFRAIDALQPIVVLVGDYVDRGPDSKAVLELLTTKRPSGFEWRFLSGNHEAAMLRFLDDPLAGRAWLEHGGLQTLASYGVYPLPSAAAGGAEITAAAAQLNGLMPDAHRVFLRTLERYVVLGDYCFVHAGIDPKRALDAQKDADLFWIRGRFLDDRRPLPYKIIHGHTPISAPFQDGRRIGIDTGAYFSGTLTAVRLQGEAASFIEVR